MCAFTAASIVLVFSSALGKLFATHARTFAKYQLGFQIYLWLSSIGNSFDTGITQCVAQNVRYIRAHGAPMRRSARQKKTNLNMNNFRSVRYFVVAMMVAAAVELSREVTRTTSAPII